MSALPKAVRSQIEQANKLAEDYYKSLRGDAPAPTGDPAAPPAGDQPAPPAGDAPAPAQPPAGDAPPPAPLPVEGWEQKYKVLQGKYNAEVPRLQNKVRDQDDAIRQMRDQLTATQNLLASLSAQRVPAPPGTVTPTAPPAQPTRLVKDEEIREFGTDLIDVVRRVAREENSSLLTEIDRRVKPVADRADQAAQLANGAAQRVARSDKESVMAMLTSQVPEWEAQNEDPGFLEWLDQRDPFSGQQRGALLDQAMRSHDGPRVVMIFKGYQQEHAALTPPAPPAAALPAPATPKKLDDFVAPGTPRTGGAGTQDGSGKRVWTRKEIGDFYSSVQSGSFKGNAEQRKKLEADIFAAQREGRIR